MPGEDRQIVAAVVEQAEKLLEEGRAAEAVEILIVGTTAFPESARLWNRLGSVFAGQGDRVAALGYYIRAFEIDPGHRETVVDCFRMFRRAGDDEDALDLAAAYVDLRPEDHRFAADLADARREIARKKTRPAGERQSS